MFSELIFASTVLDDNKKLCLTSGEIIALNNAQTMMFEVEDLAVASPATVSRLLLLVFLYNIVRCGMIYMEPGDLGTAPLVTSGLKELPKELLAEHEPALNTLFSKYLVNVNNKHNSSTRNPPYNLFEKNL